MKSMLVLLFAALCSAGVARADSIVPDKALSKPLGGQAMTADYFLTGMQGSNMNEFLSYAQNDKWFVQQRRTGYCSTYNSGYGSRSFEQQARTVRCTGARWEIMWQPNTDDRPVAPTEAEVDWKMDGTMPQGFGYMNDTAKNSNAELTSIILANNTLILASREGVSAIDLETKATKWNITHLINITGYDEPKGRLQHYPRPAIHNGRVFYWSDNTRGIVYWISIDIETGDARVVDKMEPTRPNYSIYIKSATPVQDPYTHRRWVDQTTGALGTAFTMIMFQGMSNRGIAYGDFEKGIITTFNFTDDGSQYFNQAAVINGDILAIAMYYGTVFTMNFIKKELLSACNPWTGGRRPRIHGVAQLAAPYEMYPTVLLSDYYVWPPAAIVQTYNDTVVHWYNVTEFSTTLRTSSWMYPTNRWFSTLMDSSPKPVLVVVDGYGSLTQFDLQTRTADFTTVKIWTPNKANYGYEGSYSTNWTNTKPRRSSYVYWTPVERIGNYYGFLSRGYTNATLGSDLQSVPYTNAPNGMMQSIFFVENKVEKKLMDYSYFVPHIYNSYYGTGFKLVEKPAAASKGLLFWCDMYWVSNYMTAKTSGIRPPSSTTTTVTMKKKVESLPLVLWEKSGASRQIYTGTGWQYVTLNKDTLVPNEVYNIPDASGKSNMTGADWEGLGMIVGKYYINVVQTGKPRTIFRPYSSGNGGYTTTENNDYLYLIEAATGKVKHQISITPSPLNVTGRCSFKMPNQQLSPETLPIILKDRYIFWANFGQRCIIRLDAQEGKLAGAGHLTIGNETRIQGTPVASSDEKTIYVTLGNNSIASADALTDKFESVGFVKQQLNNLSMLADIVYMNGDYIVKVYNATSRSYYNQTRYWHKSYNSGSSAPLIAGSHMYVATAWKMMKFSVTDFTKAIWAEQGETMNFTHASSYFARYSSTGRPFIMGNYVGCIDFSFRLHIFDKSTGKHIETWVKDLEAKSKEASSSQETFVSPSVVQTGSTFMIILPGRSTVVWKFDPSGTTGKKITLEWRQLDNTYCYDYAHGGMVILRGSVIIRWCQSQMLALDLSDGMVLAMSPVSTRASVDYSNLAAVKVISTNGPYITKSPLAGSRQDPGAAGASVPGSPGFDGGLAGAITNGQLLYADGKADFTMGGPVDSKEESGGGPVIIVVIVLVVLLVIAVIVGGVCFVMNKAKKTASALPGVVSSGMAATANLAQPMMAAQSTAFAQPGAVAQQAGGQGGINDPWAKNQQLDQGEADLL